MKHILDVSHLIKKFGNFTAVDDISFQVQPGEILGLLGPNGAGKTTTIQMLLGTMIPTAGSIYYLGKDFFKHRAEILQHVSFASTYVRLPSRLTVYQNLDIYGQLYGIPSAERRNRIKHFLTFFGIWDIKDRDSGVLSAGQITRVMLAKAFLSYPSIVLLDEPTASLDPDIAHNVREFILTQQKEYGVSVLLTSHNMDEVTTICNRVLVLQKGAIIANNTPKQLARTITNTRVHVLITRNIENAYVYLNEQGLVYRQLKEFLEIEIDEHKVAQLLNDFSKRDIYYDQISIDKPTLEDYFLQIVHTARQ